MTASLGSGGPRNSFDGHDDDEGTGSFENTIKALDPDIEIALMVMMMRGQGVFRTL